MFPCTFFTCDYSLLSLSCSWMSPPLSPSLRYPYLSCMSPQPYLSAIPIPTMSPDPIHPQYLPCHLTLFTPYAYHVPWWGYIWSYLPCPLTLFIPYTYHVPRLYLSPTPGMSPDPIYHLPLSRPLILFTPYLPPCTSLDPVPFRHNNLKESVGGKPCSQEYARCNHHMRVWINLPASGACNDQ